MKKQFIHIIISIFLGLGSGQLSAQNDSLSLQEAIILAKKNAISQKIAILNAENAEFNLNYLSAQLRPQMAFDMNLPNYYKSFFAVTQPNGSISFQSVSQNNSSFNLRLSQQVAWTNTTFFAQTTLQRFDDFTEDLTSYYSIPFRVGFLQPLNQVNQLKWSKKIFQLEREIANEMRDLNNEVIAVQVCEQFFALLTAQVNREIALSNKNNSQKLYDIAQERYELGKISKSDLLQLELQWTNAQQSEKWANRAVLAASANLKSVMNWKMTEDEAILAPVPLDIVFVQIDPEKASLQAWQNRPEKKDQLRSLLEAQRALEEAKKNHGWQANLQASVGFTNNANQLESAYMDSKNEIIAQISITVPILDGGRQKYAVKNAESNKRFTETQNLFDEQTFKQNVRQLVQQFNELQAELLMAQKAHKIAEERYGIANQSYLLGSISTTDLILAFEERDSTWRNYISLLRTYWISYYTIRQLTLTDYK